MRDRDTPRIVALVIATVALWGAGCEKRPAARGAAAPDSSVAQRRDARGPAATPAPPASRPAPLPPIPAAWTACATDADCVAVAADCCGCTAGGTATALERSHRAAWEALRKQRCADVACITMMSTDPSCAATPRCVTGSCRLVP